MQINWKLCHYASIYLPELRATISLMVKKCGLPSRKAWRWTVSTPWQGPSYKAEGNTPSLKMGLEQAEKWAGIIKARALSDMEDFRAQVRKGRKGVDT